MWALFGAISNKLIKPLKELIESILAKVDEISNRPPFAPVFRNREIFMANGVFVPKSDVIWVTGIGSGGPGGRGVYNSSGNGQYGGGGGAAGQSVFRYPITVEKGVPLDVTVGAGNTVLGDKLILLKGAAGSTGSGDSGGSASTLSGSFYGVFTVILSGHGGRKGGSSAPSTAGTNGADYFIPELNRTLFGGPGGAGSSNNGIQQSGGGGGAPGFLTQGFFGLPIATGTGGASVSSNISGRDGSLYGAGGSGGGGCNSLTSGTDGGLGANGVLIIEW